MPLSAPRNCSLASTWMTLHVQLAGEHLHHLSRLVKAQQAVVDEDAGQLSPMARWITRGNAGIDAAGQAQDHFLLVADLLANGLDRFGR
jgi:hypothetical protein